MKKRLIIFAFLGLFMIAGTPVWAAPAQWSTYSYNLQRTGQVPYQGPEKPLVKWSLATDSPLGPMFVGQDGSIYVRWPRKGSEQELDALDPDGNIKWKLKGGGTPYVIGADGTIYSSWGAGLCALTPEGELKYITREQDLVGDLTVTPDGTIYSTTHDKLYALNMDGSVKWGFATSSGTSLPAVAKDGTIYLGSDENVYALNPDGTIKWKFSQGMGFETPVVAPDGTIYSKGSVDGQRGLCAISPDGTLKWVYEERDITYQGTHYGCNIISSAPSIAKDGTIYIGTIIGLSAVNPDGTLKWRFGLKFPGGVGARVSAKPIIDSNGTIYIFSRDWNLYAVNPDSKLKWKFCLGGIPLVDPIMASDGTIIVSSIIEPNHGKLWAISSQGTKSTPVPVAGKAPGGPWPMLGHDPQHSYCSPHTGPAEPEVKWIFTSGKISGPPVIAPDGSIYFGTERKLYALNPDGSLKWRFDPGRGYEVETPAIGSDGTIYVVSGGDFYVLSPDRTVKEEFHGISNKPPSIAPDGTVYLSGGGYLYAYHPGMGFRWRYYPAGGIASNPVVASDGTVYIGSSGSLYALNPDMTLKWKFTIEDSKVYRIAIGSDDIVYFYADGTYTINPDGTLKWKFKDNSWYSSPVVDPRGIVYVDGRRCGDLCALNPDGTLKWKFHKEYGEKAFTPVVDSQGTVYFGSESKHLFAVNPDGSLKWKLKLEDEVYSPVIDAEGTLYVPVRGGKLYAISSK